MKISCFAYYKKAVMFLLSLHVHNRYVEFINIFVTVEPIKDWFSEYSEEYLTLKVELTLYSTRGIPALSYVNQK